MDHEGTHPSDFFFFFGFGCRAYLRVLWPRPRDDMRVATGRLGDLKGHIARLASFQILPGPWVHVAVDRW